MELIALQVKSALAGVPAEKLRKCDIAYEPIWAIDTGKTATAEQAAEVCILRSMLALFAIKVDMVFPPYIYICIALQIKSSGLKSEQDYL